MRGRRLRTLERTTLRRLQLRFPEPELEHQLEGLQAVDAVPHTIQNKGFSQVFEIVRESQCSECGVEMLQGSLLFMEAEQPLCMQCAGFGDLEYLPAGDMALTRRATKYSERIAVVVRFSRSRKRYERQGILVEIAPQ